MTQPKIELTTTFAQLKAHDACREGLRTLMEAIGTPTEYGPDKPINLLTILESNDLFDMLWCLRAVKSPDLTKAMRLIAAKWIEDSEALVDGRKKAKRALVRKCAQLCQRHAQGKATPDELYDAAREVRDAFRFSMESQVNEVRCLITGIFEADADDPNFLYESYYGREEVSRTEAVKAVLK